jgi:hypothetical protein
MVLPQFQGQKMTSVVLRSEVKALRDLLEGGLQGLIPARGLKLKSVESSVGFCSSELQGLIPARGLKPWNRIGNITYHSIQCVTRTYPRKGTETLYSRKG